MPEGKFVEFGVTIGSKKLPEYKIKNQVFTEVDLHGPTSFLIEEDGQKYPVVPFSISMHRLCRQPLWVSVYLDGQLLTTRPFCGRHLTCDAVKVGNELHELLFSLPMIKESQKKVSCLGQHAGTISVVCAVAIERGEKRLPVFQIEKAKSEWGRGEKLHQLTKKDIGHYQKSSLVSREGRLTSRLMCMNEYRYVKAYAPSDQVLEELVLNYRPRIYSNVPAPFVTFDGCSDFSKVDPHSDPEAAKTIKTSPCKPCADLDIEKGMFVGDIPQHYANDNTDLLQKSQPIEDRQEGARSNEQLISPENIKRRESSAAFMQQISSDVGLIAPENIKRRASEMFQAIRIKQEKHDESIIVLGDSNEEDILYEEYEDDSVIYMGDDDCCILELSNNFSIVELEESMLDDSE